MRSRTVKMRGTARYVAAAWLASCGFAAAQPAPVHMMPQSMQLEHKATLEELSALARRKPPVGPAADKVLVLLKKHMAREKEYIFPPLTLLPLLAEGKVTPDMAWALDMTNRVRAEREQLFQEHTAITEELNGLLVAATRANDRNAKEFAQTAAADALADLEIIEPTLILINDVLRAKLPNPR